MRILFLGDVYGRPGRQAVLAQLPLLREEFRIDVTVVNCENMAAGRGITPDLAQGLLDGGVDVLTGGNHSWHHREIKAYIAEQPRLIRPANHENMPGLGATRFELKDGRVLGVLQVEGRVFMRYQHACPFETARQARQSLGDVTASLLDVHAETTSEKAAMAWHMDGFVSAVIGTHTHVQTADERIMPSGTAFMTDAGMCGPYASVIGMDAQVALERFLTGRAGPHTVASDDVWVCGAVIETDDATGRATAITRLKRAVAF